MSQSDRTNNNIQQTSTNKELDANTVSKWIDERPEFLKEYFLKKATQILLKNWFNVEISPKKNSSGQNCDAVQPPRRKISAANIGKDETLGPLIQQDEDGTTTFVTDSPPSTCLTQRRLSREVKQLDERELLKELAMDVCYELDCTLLAFKILSSVATLLSCDRCSLFIVKEDRSFPQGKCLAASLFDVNEKAKLEDATLPQIKLPLTSSSIAGHVAVTGQPVSLADAYNDLRFNKSVDKLTGYKTRSLLCLPIKDVEGRVLGVAQAINKNGCDSEKFTDYDEKMFESYLAFCGIGLRNASLYRRLNQEHKRAQLMLDMTQVIFEEQQNTQKLLSRIMFYMQQLLECQRCQILLVDSDENSITKQFSQPVTAPRLAPFSGVFDLSTSDSPEDENKSKSTETVENIPFPVGLHLLWKVVKKKKKLNMQPLCKDKEKGQTCGNFNNGIKSVLCMPVTNSSSHVVAVVVLVNKLGDEPCFSSNDETLLEGLCVYIGMAITNTQAFERTSLAVAKQRVALEVMAYHATASMEDTEFLYKTKIPSCDRLHLKEWTFSDFALTDEDTVKASVRMFIDLNMIKLFKIDYLTLCRWVLSVKKNYRNVTYHNWRHAFNVAQTMFAIIKTGQIHRKLTCLEVLALLVACFSHDLDHRGTNNTFQKLKMTPLAQVYSSSTLERHHFDQCIMIINTRETDILSGLTAEQRAVVIRMLESAILATDLAVYFRILPIYKQLVQNKKFNMKEVEHRELLRSMLMTASDVSAISKPWEVQKKVAEKVAGEFFEQGDLERKELKKSLDPMFDRNQKEKLPILQVGFINSICQPAYEILSEFDDNLEPLLSGCLNNKKNWQHLADKTEKKKENEMSMSV